MQLSYTRCWNRFEKNRVKNGIKGQKSAAVHVEAFDVKMVKIKHLSQRFRSRNNGAQRARNAELSTRLNLEMRTSDTGFLLVIYSVQTNCLVMNKVERCWDRAWGTISSVQKPSLVLNSLPAIAIKISIFAHFANVLWISWYKFSWREKTNYLIHCQLRSE